MTTLRLWLLWLTALWALLVAGPFASQGMFAHDYHSQARDAYDHSSKPIWIYDSPAMLVTNESESQTVNPRALFATCAGFLAAEETVTLYRGVNNSHVAFESAEQGLFRANGGLATPLEHNTVPGATLRSPYTSWTTDPAVAENFALRPSGGGVVIRDGVPVSQTVPSPNLKSVLLRPNGSIVSESEVLVRGTVRGTPTRIGP